MEPIYVTYQDYKWWEGAFGGRAEERTVVCGSDAQYFKYLTAHTPAGEVFVIIGPAKESKQGG